LEETIEEAVDAVCGVGVVFGFSLEVAWGGRGIESLVIGGRV
jgi:hypothetical protein